MANVVLVDKHNKEIGLADKYTAHQIPVPLHRAISIVVVNKDKTKMLITKRAKNKFTWPGIWSNAVCSHPYEGESFKDAAVRRIREEIGIDVDLMEIFRFIYNASIVNSLFGENEYDVVFMGQFEGKIKPNIEEISDYKWIKIADLKKDIQLKPQLYTPWLSIIMKKNILM